MNEDLCVLYEYTLQCFVIRLSWYLFQVQKVLLTLRWANFDFWTACSSQYEWIFYSTVKASDDAAPFALAAFDSSDNEFDTLNGLTVAWFIGADRDIARFEVQCGT